MGKTRRRVTFLVLSLEALGLGMLALAVYLAGDVTLKCERPTTAAAGQRAPLICEASERRLVWLFTFHRRSYTDVRGVVAEPPALGRNEHWLSLETGSGRQRVLAGGARRTASDVARLQAFLAGEGSGEADVELVLRRSAAPWALAAAFFGFMWILVISLIMREFLGYHTPWWWRAFRGPRRRRRMTAARGQTEGSDLDRNTGA